jgi:ubiquinone/menaquinone biosynthesis C-methylase UbiE
MNSRSINPLTRSFVPSSKQVIGEIYKITSDWQACRWLDLVNLLNEQAQKFAPTKALDLGCGTGQRTKQLLSLFPSLEQITAIDSDQSMIEVACRENSEERIEYQLCSINNVDSLDLRDIDCVSANYSLHWVTEKERLFRSLKSSVCPGALFLLGTCSELPPILKTIDTYVLLQFSQRQATPFFFLNFEQWRHVFHQFGWHVLACKESRDRHSVKSGYDYLLQWYAASAGKAFYGKALGEFPDSFVDTLLSNLNEQYGSRQTPGWEFDEETLLMLATKQQ